MARLRSPAGARAQRTTAAEPWWRRENTTASDTGEIESGDSNVELALTYRAQYRRYLTHLETAALKHAQAL